MDTEKKRTFLINAAYYGAIVAIAYFAMRYLLGPLSPFIAGFIIAWLLYKPARALARKLRVPGRIGAFAVAAVFYVIVFAGALTAGVQVISAIENLVPQIPRLYAKVVLPYVGELFEKLDVWMADVDPAVADVVERMATSMVNNMQSFVSSLPVMAVRLVSGVVTGMPNVILSVVLTVISTFFISQDYDRVLGFLKGLLPESIRERVGETVVTGVDSIRKILGSYILIMVMSFGELSLGFLLLNVPYAVGLALLVAVIDIMPVLGTGLVLIPWAIIAAILGSYKMAIGVAALYIVMLAVRNVVEPKLVGQQMGLHPLVTLIAMFVGLQLFGLAGLFGFPIALSLYFKMVKSGKSKRTAAAG